MHYTSHYDSPLGDLTLASNGHALTGLWFAGQNFFGSTLGDIHSPSDLHIFSTTKRWLDLYFNGIIPDFTPELNMICSPFRKSVWNEMLCIPYGQTVSYGDIARNIALQNNNGKVSAQSVGGAVGHNAISIIIPCHRVIGSDGSLTGYAGGIDKKIWLLEHEKSVLSRIQSYS